MDYILQLRELIGHRPILMVGAAVLVIDEHERLLLMQRSDSGCWGPPGGATEPGERVEAAAHHSRHRTVQTISAECSQITHPLIPVLGETHAA